MAQWNENEGASQHVLRLLEESGALLEPRVSERCQEFARSFHKKHGMRVRSDSITYGSDTYEGPLRQIDQCVSLYKEFVLDERTGITLHVQIPIEVKNRRDVEAFGIEYPSHSYRPLTPITASIQGSRLGMAITNTSPFQDLPLLAPVFLEIKDGSTPKKVLEENLLHNAACAAYDFIQFELGPRDDPKGSDAPPPEGDPTIRKMRLVERFEQYLDEKHYVWWSVIYQWMRSNLTDALVAEFNRRLYKGRMYHSIYAYFPLLCINGRIWKYSASKFSSCEALLARVRVNRWPGHLRQRLLRYTTEVPMLVTNPEGLNDLLAEALRWFLKVENDMKSADKKTKQRWHLESAFYQTAVSYFMRKRPDKAIRSDLDFFELMQNLGKRALPGA